MRPRSGLRRPESAHTLMTAKDHLAHRFSHALREKITAHRFALAEHIPPPSRGKSQDADASIDSNAAFFAALREREEAQHRTIQSLALCPKAAISSPLELSAFVADNLPLLRIDKEQKIRLAGDNLYLLESWLDDDDVLVTDEPRYLRVLPFPSGPSPPLWREFAVGSLLMSSLATAGLYDSVHSPHGVSIHRVNLKSLYDDQLHLRLDRRQRAGTLAEVSEGETIGVLMDVASSKASAVRRIGPRHDRTVITTEPFSDCELFQWFYLQLLLRVLFDARLDPSIVGGTGDDAKPLRTDLLRKHNSGQQSIVVEFPHRAGTYLRFPPKSTLLSLMAAEAIQLQQASGRDCLLGSRREDDLPCVSHFGRHLVDTWACTVQLTTAASAEKALGELFEMYQPFFGAERSDVIGLPVAPRVLSCTSVTRRRLRNYSWLHEYSSPLLRELLAAPSPPRTALRSRPQSAQGGATTGISELKGGTSLQADSLATRDQSQRLQTLSKSSKLLELWRRYVEGGGDVSLFDVPGAPHVTVDGVLGRGGSGLVFRGTFLPEGLATAIPVAVKCFIYIDKASHEAYVKECLTDLAFFAVMNQVDASSVAPCAKVYDFFITNKPLQGMSQQDWEVCLHHESRASGAVKLCFLVTDLMDKTLGRFLTPEDNDYDPSYDTIVNDPLTDIQVFTFLYTQLILRGLFGYTVHDLMLHGQLRGDNLGLKKFIPLASPAAQALWFEYEDKKRNVYLKFPLHSSGGAADMLYVIDVGQGVFPAIQKLTSSGLIGSSIVDSCLEDDGMGRYWPPDELYAKDIAAQTSVGKEALRWASTLRIKNSHDARRTVTELCKWFAANGYGVEDLQDVPSLDDRRSRVVWSCTDDCCDSLLQDFVYREV